VVRDRAAREREELARRADAEQAANLPLGKAEQLTDQAGKARLETVAEAEQAVLLWQQAEDLVGQAEGVLASALGAEAARERLAERHQAVDAGLRQAVAARNQAHKEAKLLADLDNARALLANTRGGSFDYGSADRAYVAAVAAYGLDVFGQEPGAVAAAIRKERPAVRLALVVAFNHWAFCARDKVRAPRLRQVAGLADDDRWRRRYRAAEAGGDLDELKRLAGEARGQPLQPISVELLAVTLRDRGGRDEAVALLRQARGRHPEDFWIHFHLGNCLRDPGHPDPATLDEQLGCDWAALALRPGSAAAHNNLGIGLKDKGLLDEAIAHYRKAIDIDPKISPPHTNLGSALADKGLLDEAIAECRKAIELDPKHPVAYGVLGLALKDKGLPGEAIRYFQKAIELDPRDAHAHTGLGLALFARGQVDEAIVYFQKSIELDPRDAITHSDLGNALSAKGRWDEAIQHCREALRLKPKLAAAHNGLGNALRGTGRLDEAIAEYQKAIDLDPKYAPAHSNLGVALSDKDRWDEAIAHLQKAIDLAPKLAQAHSNLGLALGVKGLLDEAIAQFQKAIEIDPKDAKAHGGLGMMLQAQGRFAEARDATRRALDLVPQRDPLRGPLTQKLQTCERLLALDAKLTAILKGDAQPANNQERLQLAYLCYQYKKRYVVAVGFFTDAFTTEPMLTSLFPHRNNAALAAALAAAGKGEDAGGLEEKERARLRKQALNWLQADLKAWARKLDGKPARVVRDRAATTLRHWQGAADLVGVRHPWSLLRLPAEERREWQKLWADVDDLLRKAGNAGM
jgi:tetratricopeptide (TPR) repeat protein